MKLLDRFTTNPNTIYLQSTDVEKMREKWVIFKMNRSIYLNANGTIKKGFINIFDDKLIL